jgi:NitT/TauT family transport system substrate-binding protein
MWRCALIALLFALGCGQPTHMPFRVGVSVFPGYEFLHLADDLDFVSKQDIRLIDYLDLGDSRRAFELGQVDALLCTNAELEILAAKGFDLTVVYVLDASIGADLLVAAGEIGSLEDLHGKRLGMEHGAVSSLLLKHLVERFQLKADSIQLYHGNQNELIHVFMDEEIDAVVTYYPYSEKLMKRESAHVIYDSSQHPDLILDLFAVSSSLMEERADDVDLLIEGLQRALDYRLENPKRADSLMANRERIPAEEFSASLGYLKMFTLNEQALFFQDGLLRKNLLNCNRLLNDGNGAGKFGHVHLRNPVTGEIE